MKFRTHLYLIFAIIIFIAIDNLMAQDDPIKSLIKSIRSKYAPDHRTAIFNVTYRITKSGLVVRGEIDNPKTKKLLLDSLKKEINLKVSDKIQLLPNSDLGKKTFGIILPDVADMRRKPNKHDELVSQVTMGTVVKLMKKREGYYLIQSPDKYLGWTETSSIYKADLSYLNKWDSAQKVIVVGLTGEVREKPDQKSKSVYQVITGCILKGGEVNNEWISVELADGKKGYIQNELIEDLEQWKKKRELTGENLEKTARSFLGIPYIWGGSSVKGADCSGFTKIVYQLNGMELNRDANQQSEQGVHIEAGNDFINLRKGDLLFFGQKAAAKRNEHITHVGMFLEDKMFIHSSGCVRLSSFDPNSKYYEKSLFKKFIRARRIIQK